MDLNEPPLRDPCRSENNLVFIFIVHVSGIFHRVAFNWTKKSHISIHASMSCKNCFFPAITALTEPPRGQISSSPTPVTHIRALEQIQLLTAHLILTLLHPPLKEISEEGKDHDDIHT